MTPLLARAAFALLAVGWYVIRLPHQRRSGRTPVSFRERGLRETVLLSVSLAGLGIVPLVYAATGFPRFAERAFVPWIAWLGLLVAAAALAMFRLTHKALGRNWSVTLELREGHRLISDGVYARVRHPMYTASGSGRWRRRCCCRTGWPGCQASSGSGRSTASGSAARSA